MFRLSEIPEHSPGELHFLNPQAIQIFATTSAATEILTNPAFFPSVAATSALAPLAVVASVDAAVGATASALGWTIASRGAIAGVVPGKYPEYKDVAKSLGMNYFSIPKKLFRVFDFFGHGWTANESFLSTSIARGQSFYLSTSPWNQTGFFAQELEYLTARNISWIVLVP